MNFIYDIVLNFQKDYYSFFEWKNDDNIVNVKKIPLFKVSDEDYLVLKYNDVTVDNNFIEIINDKSSFFSMVDSEMDCVCLVCSEKEAMGIMFDINGNLIKRSSLLFDEEDEVIDESRMMENLSITFRKNNLNDINYLGRIEKEKRDYLSNFINGLNDQKDSLAIKYLYYEYFDCEKENVNLMKKELVGELKKSWSKNHDNIYELILLYKKS